MKLVAFLDILGFGHLIKEYSFEEYYEKIRVIVNSLEALYEGFNDKEIENEDMRREQKARHEILKKINLDIISDSMILTLDIDVARDIITGTWEKCDVEAEYLFLFFSWVSTFRILFMESTKYLLRGGIVCGEFYRKRLETKITNSTILYGEGIVRAAEIEKNVDLARIELDKSLGQKWFSFVNVFKDETLVPYVVEKSEDDKYFLNYYYCMPNGYDKIMITMQNMLGERQAQYEKEASDNVKQKWADVIEVHNNETIRLWEDDRFVVSK